MNIKPIINVMLLVLGFVVMVFPNSFQALTAALLIGITLAIFFHYRFIIVHRYFMVAWSVISLVFLGYILLSSIEVKFKTELFLKYILFPFAWLNIFSYIKASFDNKLIVKLLFNYSVFAFISVIALYFLMLNGYSYAEYFIVDPNIDSEYLLGFTLHVYGNLIFFAAGIFMLPTVYKNKLLVYLYIVTFIAVVLISGRTALLLSLLLGIFILLLQYAFTARYRSLGLYLLSFALIILLARYYVQAKFNYDVFDYFRANSIEKVKTLGGTERTAQTSLMIDRILQNPWGAGFNNIGIERNADRTFDYEVLILATVLRFGLFGFALICFSLFPVLRNILFIRHINAYKRFYLIGFCSIILFSFTNPYLESFNFQWMFFCPLVLLADFKKRENPGIDVVLDNHSATSFT